MLDENKFIYDEQKNYLAPRIHYKPSKKHCCHLSLQYVLSYF